MYFGNAWYPEHWPEARWATDLELMRDAGMNVVRIGEYAWSRIEPSEGKYDLDWLERVVDLAQTFGIQVVMCTPTDAPPAWLTQKYPEVLRVDEHGKTLGHGARRHFSPLSPRYRELSAGIAATMAKRFGKHPNVIGWQIGNEFCMYTYDKQTQQFFREWLARRYGTLDNLNQRWTTSYWCEEYSDWSQIFPPTGWPHPALQLDYFRFMSEAFRDFQGVQMQAMRPLMDKRQWITHNIHCWEDLDFTQIIADADLAGWDPYPGGGQVDHLRIGWYSDFCRTLKSRPHWIMETQPGHVNWAMPNTTLPRGAVRGLAWHFYAHGAEAVLFWQWRSALNGQEQYHGTIVAPDGKPRPIYAEIAQVGREIRELAPLLEGTRVEAQVAVLYSYADQVALKHQRHHSEFDALKHVWEFYGALRALAVDLDVRDVRYPLDGYRLVVAPHLYSLDKELIAKLLRYVQGGGHLLLGPRSGFKDEFNAMLPERQPGRQLAELLGAHVEEFYTLDRPVELSGELAKGNARMWAEDLTPTASDAQILLSYGKYNGWIDGKPAMVSRKAGKGRITYLGTCLEPEMTRHVMEWAAQVSNVARLVPQPPEKVEVCRRVGNGEELLVVINHGPNVERVKLGREGRDVLGAGGSTRELELAPYQVAIVRQE